MFAYCLNSPVNNVDSNGMRSMDVNLANHLGEYGGSKPVPVATLITAEDIIGVVTDVFDAFGRLIDFVTNDNEQAVLDAEYFAFYKGVLAVKVPFMNGNVASYGVMLIGPNADTRENAIEDVKHEYGHSVHFMQIGFVDYTATVAIPSVIGFFTVATEKYYSQPYLSLVVIDYIKCFSLKNIRIL